MFGAARRRLPRRLRRLPPRRRGALHRSRGAGALRGRRRGHRSAGLGAAHRRDRRRGGLDGRPERSRARRCRARSRRVDEIIASASSWYTYCANNLALAEAEKLDLTRVAFVGVPCQITPVRKMQVTDPAFLEQRAQEGQAHRAPDEVPQGLRRARGAEHRPAVQRGVHLRRAHARRHRRRDGHPADRDQEVQREGQGADLQARRRAGRDEPQAGAGVRAARVPPLRRLLRRAGGHLVRRGRRDGLDDRRPAHAARRGDLRPRRAPTASSRSARWTSSRPR